MRLILTRHGETIENQQGIVQGHMPGHLSNEGIEQAKKLALRLKDEHIDVIFSSDLKRACDTTEQITKICKYVPVHYTRELREADLGSFTGKHKSEIDWNNRPKDSETREDMIVRAKSLLDKVYGSHKDKTVLFVGHAGINKAIICAITGKCSKDFEQIGRQDNTSVSIFEIEEDQKHMIHLLNCTKHL